MFLCLDGSFEYQQYMFWLRNTVVCRFVNVHKKLIFANILEFAQVKKWVGIPVGSHWDPDWDPGGIYRDKNSGSRLGSRPNPDGILAGFSGIPPGYSRDPVGIHWDPIGIHRDPVGIHWDPSGIKTRDFAGSRRYPDGIPLDPASIPTGFTVIPAG